MDMDKILENEEMASLTGSWKHHLSVLAGVPFSSKAAGKGRARVGLGQAGRELWWEGSWSWVWYRSSDTGLWDQKFVYETRVELWGVACVRVIPALGF